MSSNAAEKHSTIPMTDCPSCKTPIPDYPNEWKWCGHCEWNLLPYEEEKNKTLFQMQFEKLGRKFSEQLFHDMRSQNVARPRLTISKFLGIALALSVYLVFLGMFFGGIFLVVRWETPTQIFWGAVMFAVSFTGIPKKQEPLKGIATRDQVPTLFALIDQATDQMKAKRFDSVVLDGTFNAFYDERGFGAWKKRTIGLGVPLIEIFNDEDLVAIIAHEVAHGINGDVTRISLIWTSINTLSEWYRIYVPYSWLDGADNVYGGANVAIIANAFKGAFCSVLWLLIDIQAKLFFRQSQEAEYLADRLAAEAAGSRAMTSALTKFLHDHGFGTAVQKAAIHKKPESLWADFQNTMRAPSDHFIEGMRRQSLKLGLSFDATHPPIPYRVAYLEHLNLEPKVKAPQGFREKLELELAPIRKRIAQELVDAYTRSLYR